MSEQPRTVAEVMARWTPGSADWDWNTETQWCHAHDQALMAELATSITSTGLRPATPDEEPITLGDDGRVWAGHHRLIAAHAINPDMLLPSDVIYGNTPKTISHDGFGESDPPT